MATDYGKRLRTARDHAGFTQTVLSKKTGIAQSTISTAEREGHGSSDTPVYARACGVNTWWLTTGQGNMLDLEQKQPIAGESTGSYAIDINVNRRSKPTAREVLAALGALVANADPAVIDGLAGLLASFARAPNNTQLMDSLAGLLEPAAFVQQDQRTG